MNNRVTITELQYQKALQYLDDARSKHLHLMYISVGGSVLLASPGLMLLGGIPGDRYMTLAGMMWFACLIGTVILFLTGYQRKFGRNSTYAQFKERHYSCEMITIDQLSGSEGRPPYLVTDQLGKQYICPVYLEFKQLRQGGNAIGIYLMDGTCLVMHDTAEDTY